MKTKKKIKTKKKMKKKPDYMCTSCGVVTKRANLCCGTFNVPLIDMAPNVVTSIDVIWGQNNKKVWA